MSRIFPRKLPKVNDVSCIVWQVEPVEELRYLILGTQREGARALTELLRPAGLTPAQGEVLAVLTEAGRPLTVREIGERLVCEGGSPSRLVGSLVDAGLLERGDRAGDRRAVELSLTPRGRAAATQVRRAEAALHAWLATALSDRDVSAAIRALRKLVEDRPAGQAIARRRDRAPWQ
jgi:MarR family transcriptional regulator, organic hydroperoxide resistance regulator